MTDHKNRFFEIRAQLLEKPEAIIALERRYMQFLTDSISEYIGKIVNDFNQAYDLMPFWKNYPPLQAWTCTIR